MPEDKSPPAAGATSLTGLNLLHNRNPDYSKPQPEVPRDARERMFRHLTLLYGEQTAHEVLPELIRILKVHHAHKTPEILEAQKGLDPLERFTEAEVVLITYGDSLEQDGTSPLKTLSLLLKGNLKAINILHILPFFPYSSDRGFSVVDFGQVDPRLGTWDDIRDLAGSFQLMFDGVLNHISAESRLFRRFLDCDPQAVDAFIAYDSQEELPPEQRALIFRPRTSDILTRFDTLYGPKWVWTTFSPDQIDMNYKNPGVLLHVIQGLLLYVRNGADILRLDAVTYLWAEPGTSSAHLPQTHEIVKLLRSVMDYAAPWVALLTETNVPHADNVSYFGSGRDEAHMVYNFALPPLVLHAFHRGDGRWLSEWAAGLSTPSPFCHFFNFLDSHDGVGLMGAKEILPREEIDFLIEACRANGALISMKDAGNGRQEPYEMNVTWWSALNGEDEGTDFELKLMRYMASRSVALVLKGVPAVYIHGALGTVNDREAVARSGHNRDINRGIIRADDLARAFKDPGSKISRVTGALSKLNRTRVAERAFHPRGDQKVWQLAKEVLVLERISPENDRRVLTLTNLTPDRVTLEIPFQEMDLDPAAMHDLLTGRAVEPGPGGRMELEPHGVMWLKG